MKKFLSLAAVVLLALSAASCSDSDIYPVELSPLTPEGKAAVAVDLGLPSGLKWADRNVGAANATAYGDYFAWSETAPKTDYSWDTYAWGTASDQLTKYCNDASKGKDGFTDTKIQLDLEDDAARAKWGGQWRMPTKDDFDELKANTDNEWVTDYEGTGVNGRKFTSKTDASKSIFLPAAGYRDGMSLYDTGSSGFYRSGTLDEYSPYSAYSLYFYWGGVGVYYYYRFYGFSVRPVRQ